jgi:hypothetical protein
LIITSKFLIVAIFVTADLRISNIHLRAKIRIPKGGKIFQMTTTLLFYIPQKKKYYSAKAACSTLSQDIKTHRECRGIVSLILTSTDGREWSASRPGGLTPGKEPRAHGKGGWGSSKAGLDALEEKNPWPLSQIESRIVQTIAKSLYHTIRTSITVHHFRI